MLSAQTPLEYQLQACLGDIAIKLLNNMLFCRLLRSHKRRKNLVMRLHSMVADYSNIATSNMVTGFHCKQSIANTLLTRVAVQRIQVAQACRRQQSLVVRLHPWYRPWASTPAPPPPYQGGQQASCANKFHPQQLCCNVCRSRKPHSRQQSLEMRSQRWYTPIAHVGNSIVSRRVAKL